MKTAEECLEALKQTSNTDEALIVIGEIRLRRRNV